MRTAIFGSMSVAFVSRKGLGVTETVRASSTDDRSLIISLIEYPLMPSSLLNPSRKPDCRASVLIRSTSNFRKNGALWPQGAPRRAFTWGQKYLPSPCGTTRDPSSGQFFPLPHIQSGIKIARAANRYTRIHTKPSHSSLAVVCSAHE